MWSIGCVFAEMNLKKVLFGEKDLSRQIQRMISLLGLPPNSFMNEISDLEIKEFMVKADKKVQKVDWTQLFPNLQDDGMDLLKRLLEYDPEKRISAEEALKHPFLANIHQPEEQDKVVDICYFDFEFEMYTLDNKILRELIMDEILIYNNPEAKKRYKAIKEKYPSGVLELMYNKKANSDSSSSDSSQNENFNAESKDFESVFAQLGTPLN